MRFYHSSRISSCEIQDADAYADGESAHVRFLVLRLDVMISQASLEWPVENYICVFYCLAESFAQIYLD